MGFFSNIVDRILHHAPAATSASSQAGSAPQGTPQQQTQQTATAAAPTSIQNVDVDAVLTQLASKKGGGGNWRTSIVDLLKLLDLDSSLDSRKQLATELNVHAGDAGTAEQNVALQKAVMRKLADNGGKVPDSLKS
jgi:hypothetical protein